jgi:hypothetical protein
MAQPRDFCSLLSTACAAVTAFVRVHPVKDPHVLDCEDCVLVVVDPGVLKSICG